MLYQKHEHVDTRTPLQRYRKTQLLRWLDLNGISQDDNTPVTKLHGIVTEAGFDFPDPRDIDEAWFASKGGATKFGQMKRPQLIKAAAEKGIPNPIKLKNEELIAALEGTDGDITGRGE